MSCTAGRCTLQDNVYTTSVCLPGGCYDIEIIDNFGDGMSLIDCAADGCFGMWDWYIN